MASAPEFLHDPPPKLRFHGEFTPTPHSLSRKGMEGIVTLLYVIGFAMVQAATSIGRIVLESLTFATLAESELGQQQPKTQ